jgi:hypothetical protein
MNYGDDVRVVGTLALAADIAPCRAIAKVKKVLPSSPLRYRASLMG